MRLIRPGRLGCACCCSGVGSSWAMQRSWKYSRKMMSFGSVTVKLSSPTKTV
jgi:hypothetical protein